VQIVSETKISKIMDGCVNKMVRFVNIITDICQFFVDIYQFLYKNKLAEAEKNGKMQKSEQ
jgi:hypothetical protein